MLPVDSVAPSDATWSAIVEGAARLRPLVEHVRGEIGQARAVGRIRRAAGLDHEVEVDERKVVKLHQKDLEPVLELEALPAAAGGRSGPARAGARSCRNGASGVSRPAGAGGTGRRRAWPPARRAPAAGVGGRGGRRRRAAARPAARRRSGADSDIGRRGTGALHFFTTRPMMGASGLGATVTTTRPSFRRYCCAARWTAAASTAR